MANPSGLLGVSRRVLLIDLSGGTHDARATSRPEGAIVAEPTSPSTWMVPSASKLSLSKADLMTLPFLGGSASWSIDGMMAAVRVRCPCLEHIEGQRKS